MNGWLIIFIIAWLLIAVWFAYPSIQNFFNPDIEPIEVFY